MLFLATSAPATPQLLWLHPSARNTQPQIRPSHIQYSQDIKEREREHPSIIPKADNPSGSYKDCLIQYRFWSRLSPSDLFWIKSPLSPAQMCCHGLGNNIYTLQHLGCEELEGSIFNLTCYQHSILDQIWIQDGELGLSGFLRGLTHFHDLQGIFLCTKHTYTQQDGIAVAWKKNPPVWPFPGRAWFSGVTQTFH